MYQKIPAELRALPQWVVWDPQGQTPKAPLSAEGGPASTTDPATWSTFEMAAQTARDDDFGIGFVFSAEDPYTGIDLDNCFDPDTGALEAWASKIVKLMNSYTEASPSGCGVHIIIRAKMPGPRNRKGNVEMYDSGRYFCMTGNHLKVAL